MGIFKRIPDLIKRLSRDKIVRDGVKIGKILAGDKINRQIDRAGEAVKIIKGKKDTDDGAN